VYAPNVVVKEYGFFHKGFWKYSKVRWINSPWWFYYIVVSPWIELGKHTEDKAYKLLTNYLTGFNIYGQGNCDLYFKLNIRRATFNLFYFFGIILVFSDNQKFYILISWLNNSPLRRFFFICINEISVHLTDI
jgi:hypothetical protein